MVLLDIIYYREASTKLCVDLGHFTFRVRQGRSARPENMSSPVCAKNGFIGFLPIIINLIQKLVLHRRCQSHTNYLRGGRMYSRRKYLITSSGNHYSGEDFTCKLKSVNRLLFYLTTLIRHHVYSILFPGKTYGFQRKSLYYFAFNFQ